jgi:hypothetical protein
MQARDQHQRHPVLMPGHAAEECQRDDRAGGNPTQMFSTPIHTPPTREPPPPTAFTDTGDIMIGMPVP